MIKKVQSENELQTLIAKELEQRTFFVLGICGPGGSGKTTLCNRLEENLDCQALHMVGDRFSRQSYRDRQKTLEAAYASADTRNIRREENPCNWYSFPDIEMAIRKLRDEGQYTSNKTWNNATGNLDSYYSLTIDRTKPSVILCDCIYLLHDPIRRSLDRVLLLDTPLATTVTRGKQRSTSTSQLDLMERLMEEYTIPYFNKFSNSADWVMS